MYENEYIQYVIYSTDNWIVKQTIKSMKVYFKHILENKQQ